MFDNGGISYSPPPGDGDITVSVGNVATYSCNRGYRLVGPEIRICADVGDGVRGAFSDTEPFCERKSVFAWEWFCIEDRGITFYWRLIIKLIFLMVIYKCMITN